jgi:hypothetical protein
LLLLVLLGVLGGGLYLGYRYKQNQYYVGATESGQLAIFRGVPGQIAGLDLSSVNETSSARLDDLTTVAQDRVKQGIQADSRPDAQRQLAELTNDVPSNPNLKPFCSAVDTPTSGVPTINPSAGSPLPTPPGTASPTPGRTATSAPANAPSTIPDAQPSDTSTTGGDPVGCRPVD